MFVGAAFLLGLLTGSFLNVCIRRLPVGQSVVSPGSHCPDCGTPIAWRDKIPVLSFFILGRRCGDCKRSISWRYPTVELLNAVVYVLLATFEGGGLEFCKHAVFASMMIVLIFTDIDHRVLPDRITLPGIGLGIALSPFAELPDGPARAVLVLNSIPAVPWMVSLAESLLAAAVFGGLLWLVAEAYYRIRGVEGLGLGDVKLIAMIAAFHGSAFGAVVLIIGTCAAAISGAVLVAVTRKSWDHPIPLGSYLACSALAALFLVQPILDLYWGLVLG